MFEFYVTHVTFTDGRRDSLAVAGRNAALEALGGYLRMSATNGSIRRLVFGTVEIDEHSPAAAEAAVAENKWWSVDFDIAFGAPSQEEYVKLREAVADAGFAVMQTSGKWSIHDVSEKAKAQEKDNQEWEDRVILGNIELEKQIQELKDENLKLEKKLKAYEDKGMSEGAAEAANFLITDNARMEKEIRDLKVALTKEKLRGVSWSVVWGMAKQGGRIMHSPRFYSEDEAMAWAKAHESHEPTSTHLLREPAFDITEDQVYLVDSNHRFTELLMADFGL